MRQIVIISETCRGPHTELVRAEQAVNVLRLLGSYYRQVPKNGAPASFLAIINLRA